jgi:hypothetical protein
MFEIFSVKRLIILFLILSSFISFLYKARQLKVREDDFKSLLASLDYKMVREFNELKVLHRMLSYGLNLLLLLVLAFLYI